MEEKGKYERREEKKPQPKKEQQKNRCEDNCLFFDQKMKCRVGKTKHKVRTRQAITK